MPDKSLWRDVEEVLDWYEHLSTVDRCAVNAYLDSDGANDKLLRCVARRVFMFRIRIVARIDSFIVKRLA